MWLWTWRQTVTCIDEGQTHGSTHQWAQSIYLDQVFWAQPTYQLDILFYCIKNELEEGNWRSSEKEDHILHFYFPSFFFSRTFPVLTRQQKWHWRRRYWRHLYLHLFQAIAVDGRGCILISSIASWNFIPGTTSNNTCKRFHTLTENQ